MAKNERIEINNIFYLYAVGDMFITIWTDPSGQWGTLPDYCRLDEFNIIRPAAREAIPQVVSDSVRAKVAERRKRATVKQ